MEKRRMTKLAALILAICLFVSMQTSGVSISATETENTENIVEDTSYVSGDYRIDEFYVNYEGEKETEYSCNYTYSNEFIKTLINEKLYISETHPLNNKEVACYDENGNPLAEKDFYYTRLLGKFNDFIPVVDIQKNDGVKNKPLVVVQHSFNGCKEDFRGIMEELAQEGYRVIAIDSHLHGGKDENGNDKDRKTNNDALHISSLQIALRTTIDLDVVLEYYSKQGCNINNFAITGVSMGALATYNQLAFGKYKPSVIVPIIGTPDISRLLTFSSSADGLRAGCFDDILVKFLTSLSPVNYLTEVNLDETAILAINGSGDTMVPVNGTVNFFKCIEKEKVYNQKHIIYNGVGHEVIDEMIHDTVDFIERYLHYNIVLKLNNNTCITDGIEYTIDGIQPIETEGKIYLPVRSLVTNYWGWNVGFDSENSSVILTKSDITVTINNSDMRYFENVAYLTVEKYAEYLGINCDKVVLNQGTDNEECYIIIYNK